MVEEEENYETHMHTTEVACTFLHYMYIYVYVWICMLYRTRTGYTNRVRIIEQSRIIK